MYSLLSSHFQIAKERLTKMSFLYFTDENDVQMKSIHKLYRKLYILYLLYLTAGLKIYAYSIKRYSKQNVITSEMCISKIFVTEDSGLVYVIEPLRVQYGINLHECVFKRIKI